MNPNMFKPAQAAASRPEMPSQASSQASNQLAQRAAAVPAAPAPTPANQPAQRSALPAQASPVAQVAQNQGAMRGDFGAAGNPVRAAAQAQNAQPAPQQRPPMPAQSQRPGEVTTMPIDPVRLNEARRAGIDPATLAPDQLEALRTGGVAGLISLAQQMWSQEAARRAPQANLMR